MASPVFQQTYVLQDVFHTYPSLLPCTLCLTERTLFVRTVKNGKVEHGDVNVADVVGCQSVVKKCKNGVKDQSSYFRVYYYPLISVSGILSKQSRREKRIAKFVMQKFDTYEENAAVVNRWQCAITWMLRGKPFPKAEGGKIPEVLPIPDKLLIIVNPHSGPGRASTILKEQVIPLLAESDTQYDVLVTDRANCAREYVKTAQLSNWNGIVAVSGDGLLFEIFNGIMERDDWQTAIKMPIGIIPGGSGNGLARAINYAVGEPYDTTLVTSSILNVVRRRISPMDLVQVQTSTSTIYSFLSIGWGLMADIDIESEKLRAIGEARFAVWAVIRALGLRKYKGRVSYLPVIGFQPHRDSKTPSEPKVKRSKTLDPRLDQYSDQDLRNGHKDEPVFRSKSFASIKGEVPGPDGENTVELLHFSYSGEFSPASNCVQDFSMSPCAQPNGYPKDMDECSGNAEAEVVCDNHVQSNITENSSLSSVPDLSEPVPDDWVTIDGEFILVYVCHQTHLGSDVLFAPDAKLDDGIMWLVMIKSGVSRAQVIYFLSSLQTGDHIHIPYVEVIPVHAFRLEPLQADSVLTVDGEVIPCSSIQASVQPSFARIMTR